jgi:hypothetical protein
LQLRLWLRAVTIAHPTRKRGYHIAALFLVEVYFRSKLWASRLKMVVLRVPALYIGDFASQVKIVSLLDALHLPTLFEGMSKFLELKLFLIVFYNSSVFIQKY